MSYQTAQPLPFGGTRDSELLSTFQPYLLGLDIDGADEIANRSILRCNINLRRDLYGNIVLSGGATMNTGIAERLAKEIKKRVPSSMEVDASDDMKFSVWIGGSMLSPLSSFQEMWISKAEYEEAGPSIFHRNSFR